MPGGSSRVNPRRRRVAAAVTGAVIGALLVPPVSSAIFSEHSARQGPRGTGISDGLVALMGEDALAAQRAVACEVGPPGRTDGEQIDGAVINGREYVSQGHYWSCLLLPERACTCSPHGTSR